MSSKTPNRSPFADQLWYAGAISERKCEEILTKTGTPGAFLVRDYLLPGAQYNYILSVYSGTEILHYDVMVFSTEECDLNGYSFTSLPEAIEFYTDNRLQGHYLSPPKEPVVIEIAQKAMAPVTVATQPAPPPHSTPLQSQPPEQIFQNSSNPSAVSLDEGAGSGVWGVASDNSWESYSPPLTIPNNSGSPENSQDVPDSVPDSTNKSSLEPHSPTHTDDDATFTTFRPTVKKDSKTEIQFSPPLSPLSPRSPNPALSVPSDEHSKTKYGEKEIDEKSASLSQEEQREKKKAPPPPPARVSSALRLTTSGSRELPTSPTSPHSPVSNGGVVKSDGSMTTQLELTLEQRRKKLEAQMFESTLTTQSPAHQEKTPGRLVINEALVNVSVAAPTAPNPLLLKKQEEAAARVRDEREKEQKEMDEREQAAKEEKEKEEKERMGRRFPFRRSGKGKKEAKKEAKKEVKETKEEKRKSMSLSERDELQDAFKRVVKSRETSPEPPLTPSSIPDPTPTPPSSPTATTLSNGDESYQTSTEDGHSSQKTDGEGVNHQEPAAEIQSQSKLTHNGSLAVHPEIPEEEDHTQNHTPTITIRPKSGGVSSRTSTLDRNTKPPPSTSPPSLPGSIDRRTWHKASTLERMRPGSGAGSRPGTLEQKTPPPPTSQPPPVPADIRRDTPPKPRANTAFSGGRMELADLIPGVSRQTLTGQSTPPTSSSPSIPENHHYIRRNTVSVSSTPTGVAPPSNMKRTGKEKRTSLRRGHF